MSANSHFRAVSNFSWVLAYYHGPIGSLKVCKPQHLVRQPRGGRRARWVKILQPIAASEPGDELR